MYLEKVEKKKKPPIEVKNWEALKCMEKIDITYKKIQVFSWRNGKAEDILNWSKATRSSEPPGEDGMLKPDGDWLPHIFKLQIDEKRFSACDNSSAESNVTSRCGVKNEIITKLLETVANNQKEKITPEKDFLDDFYTNIAKGLAINYWKDFLDSKYCKVCTLSLPLS